LTASLGSASSLAEKSSLLRSLTGSLYLQSRALPRRVPCSDLSLALCPLPVLKLEVGP
jgi:hypothetical protein